MCNLGSCFLTSSTSISSKLKKFLPLLGFPKKNEKMPHGSLFTHPKVEKKKTAKKRPRVPGTVPKKKDRIIRPKCPFPTIPCVLGQILRFLNFGGGGGKKPSKNLKKSTQLSPLKSDPPHTVRCRSSDRSSPKGYGPKNGRPGTHLSEKRSDYTPR